MILDIKNFANDFYNSKGVKKKILKEEMPVTKFAYASVVSTKNILKGEKFTEPSDPVVKSCFDKFKKFWIFV